MYVNRFFPVRVLMKAHKETSYEFQKTILRHLSTLLHSSKYLDIGIVNNTA